MVHSAPTYGVPHVSHLTLSVSDAARMTGCTVPSVHLVAVLTYLRRRVRATLRTGNGNANPFGGSPMLSIMVSSLACVSGVQLISPVSALLTPFLLAPHLAPPTTLDAPNSSALAALIELSK